VIARGGPGGFGARARRAAELGGPGPATGPLAVLSAALDHQGRRSQAGEVARAAAAIVHDLPARRLGGTAPWLAIDAAAGPIAVETREAAATIVQRERGLPEPLTSAAAWISQWPAELDDAVAAWLDDPSLVEPRLAAWIRVGAAPVLELGAANVRMSSRDEWSGAACPLCGDVAQCAAIVEESDALLQGAPRYLICGRCASWWPFSRVTCPTCGEEDSRRITPCVSDRWPWARVDGCDSCRTYVKTFDLRIDGAASVVPLVDDLATVALDLWAIEAGFRRSALSMAGV
jgi:hypothetical protein